MYPRRKRQKNLQKLGDVLQKTLKKLNISGNSIDQNIWDAWNKAVGPQVAAQTSPDKLRRDILFVKVSNSIWMHQLQFMKQEIMDKTNKILGREIIKTVHFSIGEIAPPSTLKNEEIFTFPDQYHLSERDRKVIEESTSVPDKELSSILKRVMTKEIIRRRMREDSKAP